MAFTEEQIVRISADKKAINNKIYTDNKGNRYKGNIDGRLEKVYTSDKQVSVTLQLGDSTQSLNTYLNNLDNSIQTINTNIEELQTFDDFVTEFMNSYTYAQKSYYKVFNYTGDNITSILTYKDSSLNNLLYTTTLIYTGDNLTSKEISKEDGSYTLTKTYTYDINNNITNIEII